MNFDTMSQQRKMILIAAAVGVVAMFLPWVSVSIPLLGSSSANGMHNSGILVFLAFASAGIIAFMGDQTQNLNRTNWMLALIAGAIAVIVTAINFFDIPGAARGYGLYIALAASIAIVAFAYMHRSAGDSFQSGFDTLKSNFNDKTSQTTGNTTTTPTTNVTHTTTNDTTRPTA